MADISNPVLNAPYDPPARHFEVAPQGGITGTILDGRRPSESFIPVALPKKGKKGKGDQAALDFDATGDRREVNSLINDIRREVDLWRARGYPGVAPYSRKLLTYWADPARDNRVLYCQREAAETAIFMTEVAGRHGTADYRTRIAEQNRLHNDGLPRMGLKMATGSGKTVVMAMLIAWQSINKAFLPRDARFAKRFLIVTPGITIRDRLRVLSPADDANYYRERDLVPPDLWGALLEAQIVITNYHAFLPREQKEFQGVSKTTKLILKGDKKHLSFEESPDQMVARVLRDFGGKPGELVVLNDEAHHCYKDAPLVDEELDSDDKREAAERNEDARIWFRGLLSIKRKVGIKTVFDLSATPFYLKGSGYNEGYIFPWVVSDFSLMDAIESGIVKVPRVPVDDDSSGQQVAYLHLWDHVGQALPKRKSSKGSDKPSDWQPPATLEGALRSLYRSYERAYQRWQQSLEALGEPPPVFIVVCPNTVVSKLVFDWIAGCEVEQPDGSIRLRNGSLPLFSNVDDDTRQWLSRPNTIIVDSRTLEAGEALNVDFKAAAATEIEAFKQEYRRRSPGSDAEKLTDEDLLREVMNTVGKKGKLGEAIRCVVSVSMLTEGWDANTVTHILGIRRFGSQLLCEQVVGRGLRRRSYAVDPESGCFAPEYAEVYGVPFRFMPTDRKVGPDTPKAPAVHVHALDDRSHLAISFPIVETYRMEVPDESFFDDFGGFEAGLHVDNETVALWTETQGIAGNTDEQDLDTVRNARPQEVAYAIAARLIRQQLAALGGDRRPWLFPQLVRLCRSWLDTCVTFAPGCTVGMLLLAEGQARAAERVFESLVQQKGNRREVLLPVLRRFDRHGSTEHVSFMTRKKVVESVEITKSHVNHVVLDGAKGNSWEERLTELLEADGDVEAYVKNDHLGFAIPYAEAGRSRHYVPDFLVRLRRREDDPIERTLILEVSGSRKDPTTTRIKADTARSQWCQAVNNHGGWGRWGYAEVTDMTNAEFDLRTAIEALYADGPVTGLHD